MRTIPIVLTFGDNLSLPAAVCISSLMQSANSNTCYDIIVLYSGQEPKIEGLEKLYEAYKGMRIQFRNIGDAFSDAYEIRGITKTAYYRLLAADAIPEYDKVIYADVDTIFRMDLSEVYDCDLQDNYVGAVSAFGLNTSEDGQKYIKSLGLVPRNYYVSGFLLMDLAKMRIDDITRRFVEKSNVKYKYQDQDILNLVCKGKIMTLSSAYHLGVSAFEALSMRLPTVDNDLLSISFDSDPLIMSNIHYNGVKPWKDWCPNMDQWWECYRKSPIYDPAFYFSFFYNKLEYLDQLSLLKRIKILIRYFVYGRKK